MNILNTISREFLGPVFTKSVVRILWEIETFAARLAFILSVLC